jgi:hypothetical protein
MISSCLLECAKNYVMTNLHDYRLCTVCITTIIYLPFVILLFSHMQIFFVSRLTL